MRGRRESSRKRTLNCMWRFDFSRVHCYFTTAQLKAPVVFIRNQSRTLRRLLLCLTDYSDVSQGFVLQGWRLRNCDTVMLVMWARVIKSLCRRAGQELLTIWLARLHLIPAGSGPRDRAKKSHSNKRMWRTEADRFSSRKESGGFFSRGKPEEGENPLTVCSNHHSQLVPMV